ncbi:MAG TPA: hypothetical protein VMV51_08595 [Gemmatimonadaceae bacterium]|nr:hypothetical protein [Gemmatimonadaceae bacterium]
MKVGIAASILAASRGGAQLPALPSGATTHWVVRQPHEIVGYLVFDPVTVASRLPRTLRFITIGELATSGVSWAKRYLANTPARQRWGVSFLEIVRTDTFAIDGHSPRWPDHGAVALWFARVAPADSTTDLGDGVPLLVLDFWLPDRAFVRAMRAKGYYARYGDARLIREANGTWRGSIRADGLRATATCTPTGPVSGGPASRGMQALFPPASSELTGVVRVAFAGHRVQPCAETASWTLRGTHPLARGVVVGASDFEFGYDLVGGVYRP